MNNEAGYIGNRNASIGRNAEILFKDSISEYPEVTEALRIAYGIDGNFSESMRTSTGGKCDVKLGFTCGRNIDTSLKAYTGDGYNQITRWSVDNFSDRFGLNSTEREDLRRLILAKGKNSKTHLFPIYEQERYIKLLEPVSRRIIREAFSEHPSREIFVLFSQNESIMRIWKMADIVSRISTDISYTSYGNMVIGGCLSLKRKAGNGEHLQEMDETLPEHPANDIQIMIYVNKFISLHHQRMLTKYQIFWDDFI